MFMKQPVRITSLVLAMALMCGLLTACPNDTKKSETSKDPGTQAETTTSETESVAETTEPEETTETPESSSSDSTDVTTVPGETTTATATAKPTAKPIGKTKVTDAYTKTYKNEIVKKFTCKIPKVTIAGVSTSKINKEILNTVKKKIGKYMKSAYTYYIGKTYVSILIELSDQNDESPASYYLIYNISRKTGKKMTKKQMLKTLKISNKKFKARVKKAVKKIYKKNFQYKSNSPSWMKKSYKDAISKKSINRALPYVNSKGKTSFMIHDMAVPGGAGQYDTCGTC